MTKELLAHGARGNEEGRTAEEERAAEEEREPADMRKLE